MLVIMGPVSLVAGYQQMLGFALTASLVGSRKKLGTDPRIGQPVCYGLCQEPFFLGSSGPTQLYWRLCERLPRMWTTCRKAYTGHTWTGALSVRVVLVGFSLHGVYQFESS
jgi:hypothetical protein